MATYKHLRSSTANKRPTTSITDGQLAINTNTASPGLFFKDSAGTGIVKVGPVHVGTTAPNATPAAGGSSGNYLGEQWLDTSVSPAQMKVWNGSAWVGIVADELPVSKLQDGAARQLLQTDAAGTGVEWTSNVDVPGTLDVTGAATLDSTLTVPLGSAASPTLRFSGDANSGLYSPGADQVAVATNGTGRLFVDASGRVGIGTPTPDVSLHVKSAGSSIVSEFEATAAGFSSIDLSNTAGYARLSSVASNLILSPAGTERLRITSTGLVGIGTSSPQSILNLSSTSPVITLTRSNSPDTGSGAINFATSDNTVRWQVGTNQAVGAGLEINRGAGTNNAVYIDTSNRVGIGTTSPGGQLDVYEGTWKRLLVTYPDVYTTKLALSTGCYLQSSVADDAVKLYNTANGPTIFATNNTERARIDSSGRLLVGTSSNSNNSTAVFQGNSGSSTGGSIVRLAAGTATPSDGSTLGTIGFTDSSHNHAGRIEVKRDGGTWTSNSSHPSRLEFSTTADGASSPTERMRIDSAGQISSFAADGSPSYTIRNATGAGTATVFIQGLYSATGTTTGGGASFYVFTNGNVQNTNNSYGAISDIKLKENIVNAGSQWSDIKALQVRNYNFKEGQTHTQIGLVAQEVELVSPGLVSESPDRDEDGNDLGTVTKSVNYSVLYMKAVKALQEAMERIETLEQRLNDAGIN